MNRKINIAQCFLYALLVCLLDVVIKTLTGLVIYGGTTGYNYSIFNQVVFMIMFNVFYASIPFLIILLIYFSLTRTLENPFVRFLILLTIVFAAFLLQWYMADRYDYDQLKQGVLNYFLLCIVVFLTDRYFIRRSGAVD